MGNILAYPIKQPRIQTARNIAPEKWGFEVEDTAFTTVAGAGTGTIITDAPFKGSAALRVTNTGTQTANFLTGMNSPEIFTAENSGDHVLSWLFKTPSYNVNKITGVVRIFKNSNLFNDYLFTTSVLQTEEGNVAVFNQWELRSALLNLAEGDTISMQYGLNINNVSGTPSDAYYDIDGFQIEYDDRGLGGIPSIYSKP